MVRTVLTLLLPALLAGSAPRAFEQRLDLRLIDEASGIGQSRIEAIRTRYHQPYRVQVARPPIDYIEIVTPFRRVVLLAQERAQLGRLFGQREALAALGDRSDVVEVLAEATFHPLNVFVAVPEYDIELAAASPAAPISPRSISRVPRFGFLLPGGSQPLAGGTTTASFGTATMNPNGTYEVVVSEKGKELARARVNLEQLR